MLFAAEAAELIASGCHDSWWRVADVTDFGGCGHAPRGSARNVAGLPGCRCQPCLLYRVMKPDTCFCTDINEVKLFLDTLSLQLAGLYCMLQLDVGTFNLSLAALQTGRICRLLRAWACCCDWRPCRLLE